MTEQSRRVGLWILIGLAVAALAATLNFDAIDIDSAQYASIAREMVTNGDFIRLKDNGKQYIDKPGLTFWSIGLSYLIFGVSNFAFRLPAFLLTLAAAFSISRIAQLRTGNREHGLIGALVYLTAPGLFAMVLDPKIDVYLTAYLVFTHHAYYLGVKKNRNWFYLMYVFMGLGFITKGPISAVIPAISIGGDILFRRDWKRLWDMKIPAGIVITAIPPLIWSYILFLDFSWYGPHFFLLIQSFGRFYMNMYDQKFNPSYFISNYSWAFGAFIVPLIYVCITRLREFFRPGFASAFKDLFSAVKENRFKDQDFVPAFWLFITLSLISFSRYHLPQYIYWMIPGGVLFMAPHLHRLFVQETPTRILRILALLVPIVIILLMFAVPIVSVDFTPAYLLAFLPLLVLLFVMRRVPLGLSFPVAAVTAFYLVISIAIYPELLKYQPARAVAAEIKKLEPNTKIVFVFGLPSSKRSYGHYAERFTRWVLNPQMLEKAVHSDGSRLVLVPEPHYPVFTDQMLGKDLDAEILGGYPAYKVATPSEKFFRKSSRPSLAVKILLVRVTVKKG